MPFTPGTTAYIQATDPLADLHEDLATEQKSQGHL